MTEANTLHFIIVDDDPFNNTICKLVLKKTLGEIELTDFTEPDEGFEYIRTEFGKNMNANAILLLDLNMPTMSGWEFLEQYEQLEPEIKSRIKIYILSSSVDERDIERAAKNTHVRDYLVKPLRSESILNLLT